ncbi:type IV secretion system protein [Vibrio cholerae]
MTTEHREDELNFDEEYSKRVMIRWVGGIGLVLVLSNFLFAGLFAWQFVKKTEIKHVLLQFDDSTHMVYRIEQADELEASKAQLLREAMLRRYVIDRLTVNHIDEPDRYTRVKLMSSEAVWNQFDSQMNPEKNPQSPLVNETYQSKIKIIRPPVAVTQSGYKVDFEQIEVRRGVELPPTRWSAYIQISFKPVNVEYQDRYINIDGITIERFIISQEL